LPHIDLALLVVGDAALCLAADRKPPDQLRIDQAGSSGEQLELLYESFVFRCDEGIELAADLAVIQAEAIVGCGRFDASAIHCGKLSGLCVERPQRQGVRRSVICTNENAGTLPVRKPGAKVDVANPPIPSELDELPIHTEDTDTTVVAVLVVGDDNASRWIGRVHPDSSIV
jgi:hypothetical protein